VDHPAAVQVLQAVDQLAKVAVRLEERHPLVRLVVHHLLQPPDAVLHHQVHLLLLIVVQNVHQLHDIRVLQLLQQGDLPRDVLLAIGDPA